MHPELYINLEISCGYASNHTGLFDPAGKALRKALGAL